MTCPLDKPFRMEIRSSPAHLPVVRAALEKVCQLVGFDDEDAGGIVLSVDEALANVIKHAYGGDECQPIEIEISPLGGPRADSAPCGIRLRVRDYGKQVDPKRIRSRDLAEVRPGGLGVHIISQYMDRFTYDPAEGGGTVLTMEKSHPCRKGQASS